MPFDLSTAKPIQALPGKKSGFDISTAKPVSEGSNLPLSIAAFGPIGRGSEAIRQGANLKDLPYIAAKSVSGLLGGGPERILARPLAGPFQQQPSKMNLSALFPKPATEAGKKLGEDLESIGGLVDTAAIGTSAAKTILKPVKQSIQNFIEAGAKEIPQGLQKVKREGLKQVADKERVLSGLQNVARRSSDKQALNLKDSIKNEVDVLTGQLNSEAREAALETKKILPKYFGKRSAEYGKKLDDIIDSTKPSVTRLDVSRALENTLNESGLRGLHARQPSGPVEQALVDMATDYADIRKAKDIIPAKEVLNIKKSIQNAIPQAKFQGSQPYGSNEHILSTFSEHFGDVLEEAIPGIKKLNQDYRPFVQLKRQAVRTFKPFSGEFESKGAESLLKRTHLPRFRGTSEEALISKLEQETGVPFSSKVRQAGERILKTKEGGEQQARSIGEALTQRLIELEAKKKKVGRDVTSQALGGVRKLYRYGTGRFL